MIKKPDIHPLAKKHLAELRGRWGVKLTDSETLWIIQLCDKVIKPEGYDLELIGLPVRVGRSGVYLWRFTIGAAIWFQQCAMVWYAEPMEIIRAQVFCLAHARDGDMLRRVWDRDIFEVELNRFYGSLDCTDDELFEALDKMYPPQHKDDSEQERREEKPDVNWEEIVAELETITGLKTEYWLWDMSCKATLKRLLLAKQHAAAMMGARVERETGKALLDLAKAKEHIVMSRREVD